MAVEYAARGLIAALTPQANTTVEPELWALCPPGYAVVNARLVSPAQDLAERLVAYFESIEPTLARFANAPLAAAAFACTGASYLVGPKTEDAALAAVSARAGVPVVTAGTAVCDALETLAAHRIGLVSPYPPHITRVAVDYWTARGYAVEAVAGARPAGDSFHPIYAITAETASDALAGLTGAGVEAVVLMGTGMPTLRTLLQTPYLGRAPVLSCMLALGWRAVTAADGRSPSADDLRRWIQGDEWRSRFESRYGRR